ncbi:hypothetical protein CYLTODRAFT_320851, partial [Cylindrobasidium torrendii FP15055 ss-10]
VKPDMKPDHMPQWDGSDDEAFVDWVWALNAYLVYGPHMSAELGQTMPQLLGKPSSPASRWFNMLPASTRTRITGGFVAFTAHIQRSMLGKEWLKKMRNKKDAQEFRQEGYEDESPRDYILRRASFVRLFSPSDMGGPMEVYDICLLIPNSWGTLINPSRISDLDELISVVNDNASILVWNWQKHERKESNSRFRFRKTKEVSLADGRTDSFRKKPYVKSVHLAQESSGGDRDEQPSSGGESDTDSEDEIEGHQVDLKHWKRECPDRDAYDKKRSRDSKLSATEKMGERAYQAAYMFSVSQSGFDSAFPSASLESKTVLAANSEVDSRDKPSLQTIYKTSLEEVPEEDGEDPGGTCISGALLERAGDEEKDDSEPQSEHQCIPKSTKEAHHVVILKPKQPGLSKGTTLDDSVLSVRGKLGSEHEEEIDLRHDTCADVSLIGEVYLKSMKQPPKVKKGLLLRLLEVTESSKEIEGYVSLAVYTTAVDGTILKTSVNAYVVPDMNVPILLGMDYQNNFEINVRRESGGRPSIQYGSHPWLVRSVPIDRYYLPRLVRRSVEGKAGFVKAKQHQKSKNQRQKTRKRAEKEKQNLRASQDYLIPAHSTRRVQVMGFLPNASDLLVEKNILASNDKVNFIVPNTIFNSSDPYIPVSNPTDIPRYVRRGEFLGSWEYCQEGLDCADSEDKLTQMTSHATALKAVISTQFEARTTPSA